MKSFLLRIVFALIAIVGIFNLSACVRSYNCRCVISYSGQAGLPDTSIKDYTIKDTRSKAETKCTDASSVNSNNGITTTEDCFLY